jgi:hypothetical protein
MAGERKGPKENGAFKTSPVRIAEDLADMASWIARVKGGSIPKVLDRAMRSAITAEYKTIASDVEAIKRAEDKARERHRSPGQEDD